MNLPHLPGKLCPWKFRRERDRETAPVMTKVA